ncbi:MAG: hypothetical protein WCR06_12315, partial [bacterium]
MKTKLLHVSSTSTASRADGSAKRPYATLAAARDALRKLRARGDMRMPVRVLVAPGTCGLNVLTCATRIGNCRGITPGRASRPSTCRRRCAWWAP